MELTPLNRRKFLKLGGLTLGAAVLGATGLTSGCKTQPDTTIEWIDTSYGESPMSNGKILVTYATKTGSTVGVADAIGKKLAENGDIVDVKPVKDVKDLSGYRAVVIGSAINGGQWLPEAVKFVQDHAVELKKMPTAMFMVCLMALKEDEQSKAFVAEFLKDVRALVKPVSEGRFTGAYLPAKYDLFTRIGMVFFAGYLKIKPGDFRNWTAINDWAGQLRPQLN